MNNKTAHVVAHVGCGVSYAKQNTKLPPFYQLRSGESSANFLFFALPSRLPYQERFQRLMVTRSSSTSRIVIS